MASFLEDRRQLLLFGWMGMSETASGCKYLDRSRNRLLSRLVPLRHSSVPVGEMLFAIGFTSGVEEACHCGCSAFVQDVLRGYSIGGTKDAVLASYVLLVVNSAYVTVPAAIHGCSLLASVGRASVSWPHHSLPSSRSSSSLGRFSLALGIICILIGHLLRVTIVRSLHAHRYR